MNLSFFFSIPKLNELYSTKAGMDRDEMEGVSVYTYVGKTKPRGAPRLALTKTQITEGLTLKKSFSRAIPHKGTILAVSVTSVSYESRWIDGTNWAHDRAINLHGLLK